MNTTPAPAGYAGNLAECVTTKEMTAAEAAAALLGLVNKYPVNRELGIGLWEGEVIGKLSGDTHKGDHIGVFNKETLVALFGPHEDSETETLAAILVMAVKNAEKWDYAIRSLGAMTCVLQDIMSSLPANRDWLDPNTEKAAKALLVK